MEVFEVMFIVVDFKVVLTVVQVIRVESYQALSHYLIILISLDFSYHKLTKQKS
jgi:hypothetical protein